ncbi:MAG: hypothetical protein KatS3mg054_0637 [Chloroflexus sp.]|nr:MAG: hypothetical protein KatS3mg054_0637 [Chloroflexus sp.]
MFVNLTPHTITIVHNDAKIEIPPSGNVARVTSSMEVVGEINGIPVSRATYGSVEGLPAPQDGTVYIVSSLVLSALAGSRPDVVAPDTSPTGAVRDEAGRIVGVRGFQII